MQIPVIYFIGGKSENLRTPNKSRQQQTALPQLPVVVVIPENGCLSNQVLGSAYACSTNDVIEQGVTEHGGGPIICVNYFSSSSVRHARIMYSMNVGVMFVCSLHKKNAPISILLYSPSNV